MKTIWSQRGYPFLMELFALKMGKTEIKKNMSIYFGQVILKLNKTLISEFHYENIYPIYGTKVRLWNMDTDRFFYSIDTEDLYRDIAKYVEEKFERRRYSKDDTRALAKKKKKEKSKKLI